jgi:Tfp pilus assembly protein PilF
LSGRILKWVGAATAVISLILGARQLLTIATDNARRSRESAEFVALARQQAGRGEFVEAWKSLDRADERAKKTTTDEARLDIGFRWQEDARPGPDQPFSRITDAVVPALDRALLDPAHPRRADVLAHLGWATFLKRRDNGTGDPEVQYRQALAIDRTNGYANTMLAHWLLWQRGAVDTARPYFDAALATGKERALVRNFQLAALRGSNDEDAEPELMRVANSMRQQNETLDARSAGAVHQAYVRRYGPNANAPTAALETIGVSAADQLATYVWLVGMPEISVRAEVREHVLAMLKEAIGDRLAARPPHRQ